MAYYDEPAPLGWPGAPVPSPTHHRDPPFQLNVLQHPREGKAATAKDKDRKPLDPPPIVQLQLVADPTPNARYRGLLTPDFPWTMCIARLEDAEEDNTAGRTNRQNTSSASSSLIGNIASSVHKAKIGDDDDKREVGVLVFPNLSVRSKGRYRLHFTAYIMESSPDGTKEEWVAVAQTRSDTFNVLEGRAYPGLAESTSLTRTLADQGIKLRLHRESAARRTKNHNHAFAESQDSRGSTGGKRQRISGDASTTMMPGSRSRQHPVPNQYHREPSLGQSQTTSNTMGMGQPMLTSQSTAPFNYAPTSMAQAETLFASNYPYHTMAGQSATGQSMAGQGIVPSQSSALEYLYGGPRFDSPEMVASQMTPASLPSLPQFGQNIPADLQFDPSRFKFNQ